MLAGPVTSQTIWQADSTLCTIINHGDAWFAFHKISGDTHLLNFLSYEIYRILCDDRMDALGITEAIWQRLELDAEDCPQSLVERTLNDLDYVGLIEPYIERANS
jgi:PqqD family protein of HPr-rel-A system